MQRVAVTLLLAILVVVGPASAALPFTDCGSLYRVRSVELGTCQEIPCRLVVDEVVNMTTNFHAGFASNLLIPNPIFVVNAIRYNASVNEYDPRSVANGGDTVCRANITVNSALPPVRGELRWILQNEKKQTVVCYNVDVIFYWYRK